MAKTTTPAATESKVTTPAPSVGLSPLDSFINSALDGAADIAPASGVTIEPTPDSKPPVVTEKPIPVEKPVDTKSKVDPVVEKPKNETGMPDDVVSKLFETEEEKPVEKKESVAAEETEEKANDATPSGKKFNELRKELKEERKQRAALEAKLKENEERQANPDATKSQLEKLEKDHALVLSELARTNLQATPEFKKSISEPLESLSLELGSFSKQYSINRTELEEAMSKSDVVERKKLVNDLAEAGSMPGYLIAELQAKVASVLDLREKREILLKNAKEANEVLERTARETQAAQQEKWKTDSNVAFQKAWPKFLESLPFPIRSETDEVWNSSVDKIHEIAKDLHTRQLSIDDQGLLMHQAVAFPFVMKKVVLPQMKSLVKEVQDLKAALKKYQGSDPGVGSGNASEAPTAPTGHKSLTDLIASIS